MRPVGWRGVVSDGLFRSEPFRERTQLDEKNGALTSHAASVCPASVRVVASSPAWPRCCCSCCCWRGSPAYRQQNRQMISIGHAQASVCK